MQAGEEAHLRENEGLDGKAGAVGRPATGTLGKALSLLDIVAEADAPLRFTDILARSGQPRGTLHRQLTHLVEEGLLEFGRDQTYTPGLRLLKFAAKAWARNEFRTIAEPHLQNLHALTGETVHLGVLRGNEIIYLDKVEGRQAVRMYSQIGNASPVYCTGVGKAALSALPDDILGAIVRSLEFHRFTDKTLVTADALLQDIAAIRARGYAFDLEEHETGIRCIAAPIRTRDGGFAAGLSVTGPAYRLTVEQLQDWAPAICETAGRIVADMETRLGPRR